MGKEIDSSDVIMRFNKFILPGNEEFIGKRTTHWMLRSWQYKHWEQYKDHPWNCSELECVYLFAGIKSYDRIKPYYAGLPIQRISYDMFGEEYTKFFSEQDKWGGSCTIGFLGLVLMMEFMVRTPIQLVGFGPRDACYNGSMIHESKKHVSTLRKRDSHPYDFERETMNTLEKQGRVVRLEEGIGDYLRLSKKDSGVVVDNNELMIQ
jgi:hypothetical protein